MPTARSATLQRRSLYALVAGVVLLLVAYGFWPRALEVEAGTVARGPLALTVREEGRTRVVERYAVAAPVDGQLARILLEPGDAVQEGQPLATIAAIASGLLDPARRAAAEAEWQAARQEREAASAALDAAEAERERSAAELARNRELARRGLVAAQALDGFEAAASAAAAQAASANARLRAAASRVAQARAVLDLQGSGAASDADAVELTAPVSGLVLARQRESAGPVRAGEVLVELGDTGRLEAVVEVLSADAVRIAAGSAASLHRWGGEQPLAGRVQRVEPGGFTKVSALGVEEQRVRVIVDIAEGQDTARLGDGYRVEGEFVLWQSADARAGPGRARVRVGQDWAVFPIAGGRAERVRVQLGAIATEAAQVLSGLAAGDRVILYPAEAIGDGSRVTVRETDHADAGERGAARG